MIYTIALFSGDGIGPEVLETAIEILTCVSEIRKLDFQYKSFRIGGAALDHYGVPITDSALEEAKKCDAVLLGAVGGPKWDNTEAEFRPEQGILKLRKTLEVWANLRPVKTYPAIYNCSPVKSRVLNNVDFIVLRELTGGLYFGEKSRSTLDGVEQAIDILEYKDYEIRRIVELALKIARGRKKKVTSIDKANVLESSRLWRKIANDSAQKYSDVELSHMLVDTASMRLIASPSAFDVMVTENMFGDILTDESSVLAGSMGVLPSASLGNSKLGLYEPIHGSAPDIAGKGIANPIGMILSAALMLRYSLDLEYEAACIEKAVEMTIEEGDLTPDLGGHARTSDVAQRIVGHLEMIMHSSFQG